MVQIKEKPRRGESPAKNRSWRQIYDQKWKAGEYSSSTKINSIFHDIFEHDISQEARACIVVPTI